MFGIVRYSFTIVATFCVAALCGERAFGQVLQGEAAYGGWHDDRPGLRRLLTPQDLPPIEKPTFGLAQVVPIPTGARPQVPDGFSMERVTPALRKPRVIREAPNGDLFVADTMFDAVHVLRIPPGSAHAVRDEVFASGLKQPFGIAFYPLGPTRGGFTLPTAMAWSGSATRPAISRQPVSRSRSSREFRRPITMLATSPFRRTDIACSFPWGPDRTLPRTCPRSRTSS